MQRVIASCLNCEQSWKPRPHDTLVLPETRWKEPWERDVELRSNLGFVSCAQYEQGGTGRTQKYGSGSHRGAIVTDQSFMILSQTKFTLENGS